MSAPTRVALALGSGGARGYAHIGVIEVLRERGYEIVTVAGTSMGALIGGLYAAGRLDEYTQWVRTLTQRDLLRLLDPASLRAPGAIRAEKILAKVTDLVGPVRIEDLEVPFTAVATDLLARREVWLQRGPLDVAIRASIALPPVITPVMVGGRLLVDGGLMNPVPVVATIATSSDFTIGVALSEDGPASRGHATVGESADPRPGDDWLERSRRTAAGVLDVEFMRTLASWFTGPVAEGVATGLPGAEAPEDTPAQEIRGAATVEELEQRVFGGLPSGLRTLDVMQLSLAALQSVVARFRLAGHPPDLLITIPKMATNTLDFHRAGEMIALGRERTIQALDQEPPIRA